MSITVQNGDTIQIDPIDKSVITFDYDTELLDAGAAIASSTFRLTPLEPEGIAVASITRTLLVATVTTVADHGFSTGDYVAIAGAAQADYNVANVITVTGAKTFTYAVANDPATPATVDAQNCTTIVAGAGMGFDNASIRSASPYNSRSTQVRLIGGGSLYLGRRFEVSNTIVTDESPIQQKDRSIIAVVTDL